MNKETNFTQEKSLKNMWRSRCSNLGIALIVALTTAMTLTLYPMGMFLLNNQREFWFRIADVIGNVVILFSVVAVLFFFIMAVFSGHRMYSAILGIAAAMTAVGICYYIQSNYMISYLPLMTGDEIDWSGFGLWGSLSPVLWIGVLAAFLILFFVSKKLLRNIVSFMSVILLAMEVLTLGMTVATIPMSRPEDKAA